MRIKALLTGAIILTLASVYGASASPEKDERVFRIHWDILFPAHGLFFGDDLPKCTDEIANMLAYKRDHSLMVCTGGGSDHGWKVMNVE